MNEVKPTIVYMHQKCYMSSSEFANKIFKENTCLKCGEPVEYNNKDCVRWISTNLASKFRKY
jgi:transcription initiation factor IIE alpha subunit